jgi:hypothetical protein
MLLSKHAVAIDNSNDKQYFITPPPTISSYKCSYPRTTQPMHRTVDAEHLKHMSSIRYTCRDMKIGHGFLRFRLKRITDPTG